MSKVFSNISARSTVLMQRISYQQMTVVLRLILGVAAIAVAPQSWAELDRSNLTLQQAIEKVQSYQQSQGIWQTQQQIAEANLKQSKLWSNPSLSIEQSGFSKDDDKELAFAVSQPLDVFGKRRATYQMAKLAQNQSELNQRIYSAQLNLVVKYLWSQLAVFELERDVVIEQLQVSQENLDALQKRYQAGSVAQVDVDRVRMTHEENQRLYHQADLQLQVATQQLSNLWGDADKKIKIGLNTRSLWPSSSASQVQEYLAENLVEKTRQLKVLEAKATVDYLKAAARPNPTLDVTMTNTRTPQDTNDNKLAVGVSIPLNIFNRNQYGIKIAQAKQDLLSQQQQFYLKQNALEIGTLLTDLQGLELQFKQVDQTQIPLAINVRKKTLQGFTAGKFAVSDVQQATMQLQDVRLRKVQLLKDAWARAIQAESLSLGIEPSQVMAKDALSQINQSMWQETQALPVIGGGS
ncbi:cobalt-zinc-cadmium efflux system outer membrane protein [Acinetobacter calcoaceticus]|uniref:Cobalt-zinc-cadmium efflux system outer membrane protein n=1 Tax=Acinetobacter calcoaceticus TaxID=471 RepID=A0A4R1Y916_ACICA|nr:cobalt-zinc-cadmium efflux system outer membrane protein [Acinetobacter calcoaceticus]